MDNPFLAIQNDLSTIKGLLLEIKNDKPVSDTNRLAQEEILDIRKAGEYVGLKKPTMYSLVSQRKIPFSKNGKRLMFLKSELLQWVKNGRKATTSEMEMTARHANSGYKSPKTRQ